MFLIKLKKKPKQQNILISERVKYIDYKSFTSNPFFIILKTTQSIHNQYLIGARSAGDLQCIVISLSVCRSY